MWLTPRTQQGLWEGKLLQAAGQRLWGQSGCSKVSFRKIYLIGPIGKGCACSLVTWGEVGVELPTCSGDGKALRKVVGRTLLVHPISPAATNLWLPLFSAEHAWTYPISPGSGEGASVSWGTVSQSGHSRLAHPSLLRKSGCCLPSACQRLGPGLFS